MSSASEPEFRPIVGFEGLYEISKDGRCFAVERTIFQDDSTGRRFFKTIRRHEKAVTVNGRGYPAFNLHRDNRQTCRLISVIMREAWGESGWREPMSRASKRIKSARDVLGEHNADRIINALDQAGYIIIAKPIGAALFREAVAESASGERQNFLGVTMTAPHGFVKLSDPPCKCGKLWQEPDGSRWCCGEKRSVSWDADARALQAASDLYSRFCHDLHADPAMAKSRLIAGIQVAITQSASAK